MKNIKKFKITEKYDHELQKTSTKNHYDY